MNQNLNLDSLIEENAIADFIRAKEESYFVSQLVDSNEDVSELDGAKLIRLASFLIHHGYSTIGESISERNVKLFQRIYFLLSNIPKSEIYRSSVFGDNLGIKGVDLEKLFFFYLSSSALFSENTIQIRLDLGEYRYERNLQKDNWKDLFLNNLIDSFILLVRKSDGLKDVRDAIELIVRLKEEQLRFEGTYLASFEGDTEINEAYSLIGLYHLAKCLTETAEYLLNGYNYKKNINLEVRRHSDIAIDILKADPELKKFAQIFKHSLIEIQKNSIWSTTKTLGDKVKVLCNHIAHAEKNILELLPSQRKALAKNLLDPLSNVTIVQMPTSAGKTLLAEFSILQTKALISDAKIVYIVPTRALVNQVLQDLRSDFSEIDISVEKTSATFEIDPTEESVLSASIDVLVSTPEKLDLLIRRNHKSVENVSMFIIDEAHTIQDGTRGAKLELLLAILKRERPNSKFLLLSPFIRGAAEELSKWLSNGQGSVDPIFVDWKPSEKLLIGLRFKAKGKKKEIEFNLLPSANGIAIRQEKSFRVALSYDLVSSGQKEKLFEFTARHFGGSPKKNVLFLCRGPKSSEQRAKFLYDNASQKENSELISLVRKFCQEEVGTDTTLSKVLERRIAVHHSGITDEMRLLVEHLIRKNEIKFICATTTIAQGINFPISSVFFDDFRKGRGGYLNTNDFWNIAGRAGRTLIDGFGKILLPFNSAANEEISRKLIKSGALKLTSALTGLVANAEKILAALSGIDSKQKAVAYSENTSLSTLTQYIIHLLNVSGNLQYADELEELFQDSFGYFTLRTEGEKKKFVEICKQIYIDIQSKSGNGGLLKFADKTGFSLPSVFKIITEIRNSSNTEGVDSWEPAEIFSKDRSTLPEKMALLGKLRELELGTDSKDAKFNPEILANVIIDWVNGGNISQLSNIHPVFKDKPDDERINDFVYYLNTRKFKSSWGLSALEGIAKGNNEELAKDSYIPSMVYFGVNTPEAVCIRMLGIPRQIAAKVGEYLEVKTPKSLKDVRNRISQISSSQWDSIIPRNSKLNGVEWKAISSILLQ